MSITNSQKITHDLLHNVHATVLASSSNKKEAVHAMGVRLLDILTKQRSPDFLRLIADAESMARKIFLHRTWSQEVNAITGQLEGIADGEPHIYILQDVDIRDFRKKMTEIASQLERGRQARAANFCRTYHILAGSIFEENNRQIATAVSRAAVKSIHAGAKPETVLNLIHLLF